MRSCPAPPWSVVPLESIRRRREQLRNSAERRGAAPSPGQSLYGNGRSLELCRERYGVGGRERAEQRPEQKIAQFVARNIAVLYPVEAGPIHEPEPAVHGGARFGRGAVRVDALE